MVFLCPDVVVANASPRMSAMASSSDDARGAAVMFAFMGLCSLVYAVTRATAVRRTFVTSRRMVEAERTLLQLVARRQLWRALAFAAGCMIVGSAVSALPLELDIRAILSVTPTAMLVVALVSARRLQQLLFVQGDADVQVTSHGHFLYASRDGHLLGWVAAPPKLIARATELPVARLA